MPILAKQFFIYFECSKYILLMEDAVFLTLNTDEDDLLIGYFYLTDFFMLNVFIDAEFIGVFFNV
jgi:hypothetical protein